MQIRNCYFKLFPGVSSYVVPVKLLLRHRLQRKSPSEQQGLAVVELENVGQQHHLGHGLAGAVSRDALKMSFEKTPEFARLEPSKGKMPQHKTLQRKTL